jgi:hypothetical protein
MPFLAGFTSFSPDPRPIITSYLVRGDVAQGETVTTRSGSLYELGDPLPESMSADFVRSLLRRRASRLAELVDKVLLVDSKQRGARNWMISF